jgi:hypothetical protein
VYELLRLVMIDVPLCDKAQLSQELAQIAARALALRAVRNSAEQAININTA